MGDAVRRAVLRIEGDLTIAAAAERAARLRGALPESGDLALDLEAVADCDSAGVQLLLALRHSLARQGRRLRLDGLGGSVDEALRTFGLQALFADGAGAGTAAADAAEADAIGTGAVGTGTAGADAAGSAVAHAEAAP